jgi:histidine triad (HIT) family protein
VILLAAAAAVAMAASQDVNRYTGRVDPATGLTGPYDPQNPFARILRGELPAGDSIVFQDDRVLVFMPLTMARPGHVLVIPKRQGARTLLDLTAEEVRDCMAAVQRAARAQVAALGATGFTVSQNNGISSNQHVFHPHFHVVPQFTPALPFRPDSERNTPAELATMAARLRAAWPKD